MFCSHCGNQIEEDAKFCGRCGSPIEYEQDVSLGGIPVGYQLHSSGFYYKQEYVRDNMTGKVSEKVTWFNPFTGQFKEVPEDEDTQRRERKNAGRLYVLMTACGVAMGIVVICFMPKSSELFSANISKEQIMEEQEASRNLVNAFREYSRGNAVPMGQRED